MKSSTQYRDLRMTNSAGPVQNVVVQGGGKSSSNSMFECMSGKAAVSGPESSHFQRQFQILYVNNGSTRVDDVRCYVTGQYDNFTIS